MEPGNLKGYTGTINFQAGSITDDATGEVYTPHGWQVHIENSIRDDLAQYVEGRNFRSDHQNLPGNKPFFEDDWIKHFPGQTPKLGQYPFELGLGSAGYVEGNSGPAS